MLKKIGLLIYVVLLSSCTAETYIEFDDLTFEVNGLEIGSSIGLDGSSIAQAVQTPNQGEVPECFAVDIAGIINSYNAYPALGIPFSQFVDAVGSTMGLPFTDMSIERQEGWDEWGNEVFGQYREISFIEFTLRDSNINLVLVYDSNTEEYLMSILFNIPEYTDDRLHFGYNKLGDKDNTGNVYWYQCENKAFNQAIQTLKSYL